MPWISPNATLSSAAALLAARDAAASEDGPFRSRVDRVFLQSQYIVLARWEEMCVFAHLHNLTWPLASRAAIAITEFIAAAKAHGIMQLGESPNFNVPSFVESIDSGMTCEYSHQSRRQYLRPTYV